MANPFAAIRRKPAGATYGRKALAARRLADPAGTRAPPAEQEALSTSTSSSSEASSDGECDSDASQKRSRVGGGAEGTSGGARARRTAEAALARLDSLYESTKAAGCDSASPSALLESTKHSWDLGGSGAATAHALEGGGDPVSAQQARRAVKDNTDILVYGGKLGATAAPSAAGTKRGRAAKRQQQTAPARKDQPAPPDAHRQADGRIAKTKAARAQHTCAVDAKGAVSADTAAAASPPAQTVHTGRSGKAAGRPGAWDMGELLLSSPISAKVATRGSKAARPQSHRCRRDDLPSSSPPSTPGRLVDSSKSSRLPSSLSASDNESDGACVPSLGAAATPAAPRAAVQPDGSPIGPSVATSKRLQSRAFSQNVVYTYGRSRDDEDDDLVLGFSRALGGPRLGEAIPRPLLTGAEGGAGNAQRPGGGSAGPRALGPLFESLGRKTGGDRPASPEPFKRRLGDALRGFGASDPGLIAAACVRVVDLLADDRFREDLLASKHAVATLLSGMQRARRDPLALASTMLVVAVAFSHPALMHTLVFERHALEIVAEILKATAEHDMLAMRECVGFPTDNHRRCTAQICALARGLRLVGDSLPVSTYNLALAALHGFTRCDDAAFLAMAPLLRCEMHESGCLGLVAERAFGTSIPLLVQSRGRSPVAPRAAATSAPPPTADADTDGMWMGLDLPEEARDTSTIPASGAATGTARHRESSGAALRQPMGPRSNTRGTSSSPLAALLQEPAGADPTSASVALELEILQFCATASPESQSEMLAAEASVSGPLALLAQAQRETAQRETAAVVPTAALEMAVLVLQLLVNLSNGSTEFCSRFVACDGFGVVAKNIVVVAQAHAAWPAPTEASGEALSPRRRKLADEASDLRYDVLLVTSALLTNVVHADPSSVVHIARVRQSPLCRMDRRCFPECRCTQRAPLVALLARAFVSCQAAATASAEASVAAGYLAVLLGFLMQDRSCCEAVRDSLPGRDVALVAHHIGNFIRISGTVDSHVAGLLGGAQFAGRAIALDCRPPAPPAAGLQNSGGVLAARTIGVAAAGCASTAAPAMAATLRAIIDSLAHV
ncbi:hypothetical protein IWQ57_003202 [Coemansia nantahalensis]|uniref:Uncharacterized protein n=1 Tax=Coemansia nantahalensis TaxID=2789366 RepID=A0ACC1JXF2_9FUNG|nr:hypothetical protein IWQ57_003202 [Coemansia nantahalensis]